METMEILCYSRIMGMGASWYRYVDDIMVIAPEETNMDNKIRMLNSQQRYAIHSTR